MATVSAREFNHDVSAAKRAASREPVVITERGRPSHVLMSFEEFERLTNDQHDVVEWLSMDDDVEFEPDALDISLKVPDL